jgi:hypothetical protein
VSDVDGFPARAASRAGVQLTRLRVAALPAAEDPVPDNPPHGRIGSPGAAPTGSEIARPAPPGSRARLFRVASCAIISDTAADLYTMGNTAQPRRWEPGGALYDKLHVSHDGYAGAVRKAA